MPSLFLSGNPQSACVRGRFFILLLRAIASKLGKAVLFCVELTVPAKHFCILLFFYLILIIFAIDFKKYVCYAKISKL